MPRPTRRERERLRHRNEILDAAEALLARKNFHECSMAEIAQEAEFAVGTLYNFFESKDELYVALLDRIGEEFMAEFERRAAGQEDPVEALGELVRLKAEFLRAHGPALRLFFESRPAAPVAARARAEQSLDRRYKKYFRELTNIIRRGVDAGAFAARDPKLLAAFFEGASHSVVLWLDEEAPDEPAPDAAAERVLPLFLQGAAAAKTGRSRK